MKLKLDRIISIATLIASLTAIVLVVKRPVPIAVPQAPAVAIQQPAVAEHEAAQPQPAQPSPMASAVTEDARRTPSGSAHSAASAGRTPAVPSKSNSNAPSDTSAVSPSVSAAKDKTDAISSALSQMLGGPTGPTALFTDSNVGNGMPLIKDQQVTRDGDVVHGRFLTEIGGRDVWVTISGRMGEKDGYATFDPTEFKIGDTSIPVSLVNPALQRKLAEERERLKIPADDTQ